MKLLAPIVVTDAILVSSTVPETDAPVYSTATTYALADKVISTSTHRVYQSAAAGNLNHPLTDPTWWTDIGPTKRWAAFDQAIGTACSGASPLEIVLAPTELNNAVALLDLSGVDTVRVRSASGGVTVYDQTLDLRLGRIVASWWDYFFTPVAVPTQAVFEGIPTSASNQLTLTFTGSAPSVGTIAVGAMREYGEQVNYGASVGIIDYSAKQTDNFGVTTVVERSYAKRMQLAANVPVAQLDDFVRMLASRRAKPTVYLGSDYFESLLVYGWARDWTVSVPYPTHVAADITVEGLV